MSFSITDAYPRFNFSEEDVKEEYIDLFKIKKIINKLDGDKIISTSLYYSPHYTESDEMWEKRYIEPILKYINCIPNEWHYEIFISPNCERYIEKLFHPKIQFNLMKHDSDKSVPGMFWRYIPLKYENKTVLFVGMDTPELPSPAFNYLHFFDKNYKIIRWSQFPDLDENNYFIYKPLRGSFLSHLNDKKIIESMSAWIQSERERIEKLKKDGTENFYRKVKYEGKEYEIFGTHTENCYGQDENFLSCYLYSKFKDEIITILKLNKNNNYPNNLAFNSDKDCINNATIIYDVCKKNNIVDNKKNICFVSCIGTSGYAIATSNFIFNYLQNNYNVTFIPRKVDNSIYQQNDIINQSVNKCKLNYFNRYDYFIVHLVADSFNKFYQEYFINKKIIKNDDCKVVLQTVWETSNLPDYWVELLNDSKIDEIWVPSFFNKKIFEECGVKTKIKVKKYKSYNFLLDIEKSEVPIPTHIKYGDKDLTKTFNFYSISSWTDRKNYKNTIKEFCKTFSKDDNVCYLIKTTLENYDNNKKKIIIKEFEEILSEFPNHPTIYLFLENYQNYELNYVHNLGDCYYLLTRGEGLGFSAYDAFLNHKPVIVTKYGGHIEYFPENYPYFVDYSLVPVDGMKNTKWYLHNHMWAEPNYEQARSLLKQVYENRLNKLQ